MIKHGMDVRKQAITFLNPAQIPVLVLVCSCQDGSLEVAGIPRRGEIRYDVWRLTLGDGAMEHPWRFT